MEKLRSLIRQVIGHKMLFVVFLLFPTDILVEAVAITNVTTHVDTTASLNLSTSPFLASSEMITEISMTSVTSPPDATIPDTLSRSLSTPGQPAQSLNAAPPVSKQELQSATTANTAVPEDTSSAVRSNDTVFTEEKHPPTEATEVQESKPPFVQKEAPSETTVTPHFDNETVSSPATDLGTRSHRSFLEQLPSATVVAYPTQQPPNATVVAYPTQQPPNATAVAYPEATKSTGPKGDRKQPMPPSQAVPELTQTPETGSHDTSGPFIISVTPINDAPVSDPSAKSPSERKYSVIVLAIVCVILLLVGLLVFLYLRRRRHSGSTSFSSPEWAGQATLPDDTGLDKDMEQQVGSVGEGEARRGTLVTFFGKRQSRMPSIAMEDLNGKESKEETQQLLCGEAETGSVPEATGDANGKVPEPLKESSQESSAPNKLGESPS